jgi:hypothetical protein
MKRKLKRVDSKNNDVNLLESVAKIVEDRKSYEALVQDSRVLAASEEVCLGSRFNKINRLSPVKNTINLYIQFNFYLLVYTYVGHTLNGQRHISERSTARFRLRRLGK